MSPKSISVFRMNCSNIPFYYIPTIMAIVNYGTGFHLFLSLGVVEWWLSFFKKKCL
jgi:hypothetical protein